MVSTPSDHYTAVSYNLVGGLGILSRQTGVQHPSPHAGGDRLMEQGWALLSLRQILHEWAQVGMQATFLY
jgi:hypothetical protein